jgi:hypothetical protein
MANAIAIKLTKKEIDGVFERRDHEKWEKILDVYIFLRENLHRADAEDISADYRRKFNYFYQVRRNAEWREKFYSLFFKHTKEGNADFAAILNELFKATGKIEASFASKFAATIDPNLPLIDRHVLSYIDQELPTSQRSPEGRIATIVELYGNMKVEFTTFLSTPNGQHLVARFTAEHGDKKISPMKILDFVLWQSGGKKMKT